MDVLRWKSEGAYGTIKQVESYIFRMVAVAFWDGFIVISVAYKYSIVLLITLTGNGWN